MCETCARLLALRRLIERPAALFGTIGTDAVLDAWFGRRSPVFPARNAPLASRPEREAS
ncbi:hypothetical protein [Kribbella sp. NPDC004536]|uniref:hypothetical protein n=1 Tax=Kribbella sp. NPDC004536 TaxID=3364106 RepID=UPI0036C14AF0